VSDLQFEWDERKNTENQRKHGVAFEEAQTVFLDDYALLIDDPDHPGREERWVLLGLSSALRHLVVVHCYKAPSGCIRIISARKATAAERETYEQRWMR